MDKIFLLADEWGTEEQFPLSIGLARIEGKSFDRHSHDFSEIVIIMGGEGIHITDFGNFPLKAGDVYVIHPPYVHGFRECRHLSMYNLSYGFNYTDRLDLGGLPGFQALFNLEPIYRKQHNFTSRLHLIPEQRLYVKEECEHLERELKNKKPGYKTVFDGRFRSLITELCRFYVNYSSSQGPEREEPADLIKLGKVLAVMEQNFTSALTVKELARLSGYSLNHFTRLCHRVYGLSPRQYMVQQRLSLAVRLLKIRDYSITEISSKCGYDDPNYFSRLFRVKMGESPCDYRKRILHLR